MSMYYMKGFCSLHQELEDVPLQVRGELPGWLRGSLYQNGPGRFDFARMRVRHWLDGMAMVHRFAFESGRVHYTNRMLRSEAYQRALATGELAFREFSSQPHSSLLGHLSYLLAPTYSDNVAVNLARFDGRLVAMGETPRWLEVDARTLETRGAFQFADELDSGYAMCPHPQLDVHTGDQYSFTSGFRKWDRAMFYSVFRVPYGSRRRELLATLEQSPPSYMHTLALTERYVVLVEFSMVLRGLLDFVFSKDSAIDSYEWDEARGTRFTVLDRTSGRVVRRWRAPPAMGFHQVNAFEEGEEIILDMVAYDEPTYLRELTLDNLLRLGGGAAPLGRLRRYRLSPERQEAVAESWLEAPLENPRIPESRNGRSYRFFYAKGRRQDTPEDFYNLLLKVDTHGRSWQGWSAEGCYPCEPLFIPAPDARSEDEGVVLCVVLDGRRGSSCLVVLDAASFSERARVEVPHAIPHGFHVSFFADVPFGGPRRQAGRTSRHGASPDEGPGSRQLSG